MATVSLRRISASFTLRRCHASLRWLTYRARLTLAKIRFALISGTVTGRTDVLCADLINNLREVSAIIHTRTQVAVAALLTWCEIRPQSEGRTTVGMAPLVAGRGITATVSGLTTTLMALAVDRPLEAEASGSTNVQASLRSAVPIVPDTILGTTQPSAALATAARIQGQINGATTIDADVRVSQAIVAQTQGRTTMLATLHVTRGISADFSGTTAMAAAFRGHVPVLATAHGHTTVNAAIERLVRISADFSGSTAIQTSATRIQGVPPVTIHTGSTASGSVNVHAEITQVIHAGTLLAATLRASVPVSIDAIEGSSSLTARLGRFLPIPFSSSGATIVSAATQTAARILDSVANGSTSLACEITVPVRSGQVAYTTPGTYTWVCPAGVTSVCVVAVGPGGNAASSVQAGGGGELRWKNNIAVTPGNSYAVVVGAVGSTAASISGTSSFGSQLVTAHGGHGAESDAHAGGSGGIGDGGGNGGAGGFYDGVDKPGGGGAGGYSGPGGDGVSPNNETPARNGTGGGGAGGGNNSGGGGVGIFGAGTNGTAPNGGGSSGTNGSVTLGGNYGGAAAPGKSAAGSGAVRIIWGPDRAFPATNTEDL